MVLGAWESGTRGAKEKPREGEERRKRGKEILQCTPGHLTASWGGSDASAAPSASAQSTSPSSEVSGWINEDQFRTISVFARTKLCPSRPFKAILPTAGVLIGKVWNDFHCCKPSLKGSQIQRSAKILHFCLRLTSQYLWETGECGDAGGRTR